jgi:hypothetical protein
LVEVNGGNVYRLAQNAQIERTTIHKAMSGERLPNEKFMEKLCSALQLTPSEKVILFEYYSIAKYGESKYKLRNRVKNSIELLGTIPISPEASDIPVVLKNFKEISYPDVRPITGAYAVGNIIKEIIEKEVYCSYLPEIRIYLPVTGTYIFGLLYNLFQQFKGKIRIRHLIKLRKLTEDMSGCSHNLDFLSIVAPFALCEGDGYMPFYYYGSGDADTDISVDTPYRIITSSHAVAFSADQKSAVVYNTAEMAEYFKIHFDKAESAAIPFFLQMKDRRSLLRFLNEPAEDSGAWYCIRPQPYFSLTPAQFKKKMIWEAQGCCESAKIQIKRLENLNRNIENGVSIFSLDGLERFVNSGFVDDFPKLLMEPFTVQERILMLTNFRDAVVSGRTAAVAADPAIFRIFETVSILLDSKGLSLVIVDGAKRVFRMVLINEESIKAAFREFLASLPSSGLVCQNTDMLRAVGDMIEKLKTMVD